MRYDKKRKTTEEFIEDARNVHGDKYVYDKTVYVNSHTKVTITCPSHGDFEQTPTNHLTGYGCSKCKSDKLASLFASNKEVFIEKARKVHGDRFEYEKVNYINRNKNVIITCPIHGDFEQAPFNHLQGKGCPYCKSSKLEKEMIDLLEKNGIEYFYQWHLPWNLRYSLDFYLPKYNVGIECQGIQHYEPREHFGGEEEFKKTIERDRYKMETCKENGINLIYFNKETDRQLFLGQIGT